MTTGRKTDSGGLEIKDAGVNELLAGPEGTLSGLCKWRSFIKEKAYAIQLQQNPQYAV
jgi:hypothetical protein